MVALIANIPALGEIARGREQSMNEQSKVLTATIELNGARYTASYFVERDMIYANFDGRLIHHVGGAGDAEETVKSLLRGFAERDRHRHSLLETWDTAHTNPG